LGVARTALSARMAVLHARGQMGLEDQLTAVSVIGSTFTGRIVGTTEVGGRPAILPEISGRLDHGHASLHARPVGSVARGLPADRHLGRALTRSGKASSRGPCHRRVHPPHCSLAA